MLIANHAARVLVPDYCLNVVNNCHIVSVLTTIDVIAIVLLSLELESLNKLCLRLSPVLPCPRPCGDCALFVVYLDLVTLEIDLAEVSLAFSI